ncbi:hypothetical protein OVA14_07225 [Agrococcus sp. SL85]|uniref:hypothetical protein n=1 Tax=Agrococcus sp. SL85 TaxID=2995141 RepID=UPI00226D3B76|nr:hypothetical protein [Agrococcus sp. SL85]WAC65184.1 hypothetical protein OVA14_07225 [Agrococcus sp. SL85]
MLEKFHYTLPDGHQLTLPPFEQVPVGLIRSTRKLAPADQAFTLLEGIITDEQDWEHLDKLTGPEFQAFQKAWKEASRLSVGESSASSTS